MSDFKKIEQHFSGNREIKDNLFTPEKRLPCIWFAYEAAGKGPINEIKIESTSLVYASLMKEKKIKADLLEIERQKVCNNNYLFN